MAGGTEFQGGKFKELVLYLSEAAKRDSDEGFGMVKLNKLLYRADFEAFRLLGKSITGAAYERQAYGPVARELPIALDELAARGYVVWHHYPAGPYTRDVPEAMAKPDLSMFPEPELEIVNRAREELRDYGGKQVSDWSHEQSAGWNLAKEDGQGIPYETAYISMDEPTEEMHAYLQERAQRENWASLRP